MLENELKAPVKAVAAWAHKCKAKSIRFISSHTKKQVYTGKCANCGSLYNLEYDHNLKFSHGGKSNQENLQILCRNCNQRKEIKRAKQISLREDC